VAYPGAGAFTQAGGSGLAPFIRLASLARLPSLSDSPPSDDSAAAYGPFVQPVSVSARGLARVFGRAPPDLQPGTSGFGTAYGLSDWPPDPALAGSSPPIVLAQAGPHDEPGEPEKDPDKELEKLEGGLGDQPRTIDGTPLPRPGGPGLVGRFLPLPFGGAPRVAPPVPTRPNAGATPSGAVGVGSVPRAAGSIAGPAKGGAAGAAPPPTPQPTSEVGAGADAPDFSSRLFRPGPYAGDSIPARSSGRDFTADERAKINRIMRETGCHSCGIRDPGTKSGNGIPDHQPVSSLNKENLPQRLYPHCIRCSRMQGFAAGRIRRRDE
jgi:hypothetical protein